MQAQAVLLEKEILIRTRCVCVNNEKLVVSCSKVVVIASVSTKRADYIHWFGSDTAVLG